MGGSHRSTQLCYAAAAGEMNDASEVLITIYDQINKGVAAGLAFSLTLDVDLDALVGAQD